MTLSFLLAASLITSPAPTGKPEAECLRLFPGDWRKIAECVSPSVDLSRNPKLRGALAACKSVKDAARVKGITVVSATIVLDGAKRECTFLPQAQ